MRQKPEIQEGKDPIAHLMELPESITVGRNKGDSFKYK